MEPKHIDDPIRKRETGALDEGELGDPATAPEPEPSSEDGPGPRDWSSLLPLVAIGVVVSAIVVTVIGLAVSSGSSGDETDPEESSLDGSPPPKYAPKGPGSDPALDSPEAKRDAFQRAGGSGELDEFPDVGPWVAGQGVWIVSDSTLRLSGGETAATKVTWVDAGATDLRAQVTLTEPAQGAGIAFRVQNADNFWLWQVLPGYSTAVLLRVEDGRQEVVGDNPGLLTLKPGMSLGVNLAGSTVELLAQGAVVLTVDDDDPSPGTGVGVGVAAGGTTGSFSNFVLSRPES